MVAWWRKINAFTKRDGSSMTDEQPPYSHCLNCGTELTGMYCHKCGQQATDPKPGMFEFVKEYVADFSCLDSQSLPTLMNLIFHPGHLVKEYCAGRHSSYAHPIKLIFFVLLVILTLFAFEGTDTKIADSFKEYTSKEHFISEVVLQSVQGDSTYLAKVEASPREKVTLVASYPIVEKYPNVIDVTEIINVTDLDEPDTVVVNAPTLLIEDKMLVDRGGYYFFSTQNDRMDEELMLSELTSAWSMLISIIFSHFPLLMFLSAPFLALAIRLVLIRRKIPMIYCFIFSLYYIAYVQIILLMFYVAGIIFDYSFVSAKRLLYTILFLYMTMALKQTYGLRSWFKSAFAAIFVNVTYLINCLLMVVVISIGILVYVFGFS